MLTYMDRLLNANLNLDKEAFEILYWLLNRDLANDYVQTIRELIPEQKRLKDDNTDSSIEEAWDFAHISFEIIKLLSQESRHRARIAARRLLKVRLNELRYEGSTTIEENILEFKRMFSLDDIETELCLFLFMIANWNEFEDVFRISSTVQPLSGPEMARRDSKLQRSPISKGPQWKTGSNWYPGKG